MKEWAKVCITPSFRNVFLVDVGFLGGMSETLELYYLWSNYESSYIAACAF